VIEEICMQSHCGYASLEHDNLADPARLSHPDCGLPCNHQAKNADHIEPRATDRAKRDRAPLGARRSRGATKEVLPLF